MVGFARQDLSPEQFHSILAPFLPSPSSLESPQLHAFLSRCLYLKGGYTDADFQTLGHQLASLEKQPIFSRLFYLALPPSAFAVAAKGLHHHCRPSSSSSLWSRLVVEKPFGNDLASARLLLGEMAEWWKEEELFRIDHYLGKSMVQSLFTLRRANTASLGALLSPTSLRRVHFSFAETLGAEGRAYFDQAGIVRDVLQNHILQMLALFAVSPSPPPPSSPESLRDAKVAFLASLQLDCSLHPSIDCALFGQYNGYQDEAPGFSGSQTASFAALRLRSTLPEWQHVPFFLSAGKSMSEQRVSVVAELIDGRNFTIVIQPQASLQLDVGWHSAADPSLQLVPLRAQLPRDELDAYAVLLSAAIVGDRSSFVRGDELERSWALLTPLLALLDNKSIPPFSYPKGSSAAEIYHLSGQMQSFFSDSNFSIF